jgi:hypothetical protein
MGCRGRGLLMAAILTKDYSYMPIYDSEHDIID